MPLPVPPLFIASFVHPTACLFHIHDVAAPSRNGVSYTKGAWNQMVY